MISYVYSYSSVYSYDIHSYVILQRYIIRVIDIVTIINQLTGAFRRSLAILRNNSILAKGFKSNFHRFLCVSRYQQRMNRLPIVNWSLWARYNIFYATSPPRRQYPISLLRIPINSNAILHARLILLFVSANPAVVASLSFWSDYGFDYERLSATIFCNLRVDRLLNWSFLLTERSMEEVEKDKSILQNCQKLCRFTPS